MKMDIQRAIEIIQRKSSIPNDGESFADIEKAYDLAVEAMEKQIAKKPIIKPWCPAICPTCGETLSEYLGDGYYSHRTFLERCTDADCSQRLDWSEV